MRETSSKRVAVVLFNLGGPDSPEAVEPFLYNLFSDPAIIRVPQPIRCLIAKLISKRRAPVAREIYSHLGGASPILPLTQSQGSALEKALSETGIHAKTFISMRYWHPFADDAAVAVKEWAPDEIVLLTLYPQYSTTTTESSYKDWDRAARKIGLSVPTEAICCYPMEEGFIEAHAALLRQALADAGDLENIRLLFSAHGLPKRVVDAGDPYQRQVEQTCHAVVEKLDIAHLDWQVCYQSRVGPMEWIGPSTDDEIARAGAEKKTVVLTPIAFVSEHSETLVELDIEYGELAQEKGVNSYIRVPALGDRPEFIAALAKLVNEARSQEGILCPLEAAGYPCTEKAGLSFSG